MKRTWYVSVVLVAAVLSMGADQSCGNTADDIQRRQSEVMLKEATAQTGMPAITNFRERKLLKDILELRDQDGLSTFAYVFSEQTGQLRLLCESVGYAIPYATQYTNPERYELNGATLPQADPNGLFSPASAEGSWIMCSDKAGKRARPVYVEPRVIVSPFPLQ